MCPSMIALGLSNRRTDEQRKLLSDILKRCGDLGRISTALQFIYRIREPLVRFCQYKQVCLDLGRASRDHCRLTHKFAKTGRYASEEENGEDMCQIQAPISFREFKKIVWERAIRNSAS